MRDLSSILSLFHSQFNKINNKKFLLEGFWCENVKYATLLWGSFHKEICKPLMVYRFKCIRRRAQYWRTKRVFCIFFCLQEPIFDVLVIFFFVLKLKVYVCLVKSY